MVKTKEALERKYNISIDIVTTPDKLHPGYDIVHIFNYVTTDITKAFFEKALKLKIPIASSSIYWDYSYIFSSVSKFLFRTKFTIKTGKRLKFITRFLSRLIGKPRLLTKNFKDDYAFFIKSSNIILPNSQEEADLLEEFVGFRMGEKSHVVVNGYEPKDVSNVLSKDEFKQKYNLPDDYILEVGRIETIKNQLNVVKSLLKVPEIPIVFIGKPTELHYLKKVQALSRKRGNVYFLESVPHEEISSFYKYAALHVLPSLRESPGLVSLEALAIGCPIVIANHKYTPVNTYFKNQKYIVDPLDLKSMRDTLLTAYRERFLFLEGLQNFTWEHAAQQTWQAYLDI